jgi:glutaminyl-tRNA synthetase
VADVALLEHSLREDLNLRAQRIMGVMRPLKLVIDNYPEDRVEELQAVNNPEDPSAGARSVPFARELFIEQEDFSENPPKKFFRLAPGRTVRLRYSYLVTCIGVVKNEHGEISEIHCQYDPASLAGDYAGGPKPKATLHWVSAKHSIPCEVRLYDRLFSVENPADEKDGRDFKSHLNPNSLEAVRSCRIEPGVAGAVPGSRYQFERLGYFCVDPDSTSDSLIFNRTVTLRDAWAKIVQREHQL